MFKRGFLCLSVSLIASVLIINSAHALPLISFSPSTQTVSQGQLATVNINIDTEGVFITGYDLMFEYDSDILKIVNDYVEVSPKLKDPTMEDPTLVELSLKNSYVDAESISDTIYISGSYDAEFDDTGGEVLQSPFLCLATLNLLASREGTSHLKFSYVTLYDESNDYYKFDFDFIDQITKPGSITVSASHSIPEPINLILFGSLLGGFCFFKRKEIR